MAGTHQLQRGQEEEGQRHQDSEATSLLRSRVEDMLTAASEVAEAKQRRRNSHTIALRKLQEARKIMEARRAAGEATGEGEQPSMAAGVDLERLEEEGRQGYSMRTPSLRTDGAIIRQAFTRPSPGCLLVILLFGALLYAAARGNDATSSAYAQMEQENAAMRQELAELRASCGAVAAAPNPALPGDVSTGDGGGRRREQQEEGFIAGWSSLVEPHAQPSLSELATSNSSVAEDRRRYIVL